MEVLIGTSAINGPFSIAMFDCRMTFTVKPSISGVGVSDACFGRNHEGGQGDTGAGRNLGNQKGR